MATAPDRTGQRLASLTFARTNDVRKPVTVRLMIQDGELNLLELLEMTPQQFADLMSGLATWVDDGFADSR